MGTKNLPTHKMIADRLSDTLGSPQIKGAPALIRQLESDVSHFFPDDKRVSEQRCGRI
jgi:hypothetical protein